MGDVATIAAELGERLIADLIKIGAPTNPFGGLFDALSADDMILCKRLGLVRCYIPDGCYAPITKLTPRGKHLVREHLEGGR